MFAFKMTCLVGAGLLVLIATSWAAVKAWPFIKGFDLKYNEEFAKSNNKAFDLNASLWSRARTLYWNMPILAVLIGLLVYLFFYSFTLVTYFMIGAAWLVTFWVRRYWIFWSCKRMGRSVSSKNANSESMYVRNTAYKFQGAEEPRNETLAYRWNGMDTTMKSSTTYTTYSKVAQKHNLRRPWRTTREYFSMGMESLTTEKRRRVFVGRLKFLNSITWTWRWMRYARAIWPVAEEVFFAAIWPISSAILLVKDVPSMTVIPLKNEVWVDNTPRWSMELIS